MVNIIKVMFKLWFKCFVLCILFLLCVIRVTTSALVSDDALCLNSTDTYQSLSRNMSLQRLTALRALMASQPQALAAYIVPTADAHNSEYIASVDARREWLSQFTGSAGTAVVTSSHALVWTDGRYYTQFENEADMTLWTLMKESLTDTPSIEKWLSTNLVDGAIVGVDPHTMTREEWTPIQSALTKSNKQIIPTYKNLVDEVRRELNDPPPPRPSNDVIPLSIEFTGKKSGEKIAELRKKMTENKASLLVITALDEVAYTLNLRGSDIDYNPVFFSYLIITPDKVTIFWGNSRLSEAVGAHLINEGDTLNLRGSDIDYNPVFFSYLIITPDKVTIFWGNGRLSEAVGAHLINEGVGAYVVMPYGAIVDTLQDNARLLSESGDGRHSIWLSSEASEAIHRAASGSEILKKPLNLISEVSPVALAKLVKNEVELQGFRACHARDGVAVSRLLFWLQQQLHAGDTVSEIQVADKLLEYRKEEKYFMGESFSTISSAGENGAIIHYTPSREGPQRIVGTNDMFLLDSGGQYKDGTTDITRTRHMGIPTDEQKDAFTRVLKGQFMMGSALFPQGVKGNVLDSFARKSLWDVGLDYGHGTGHGVGHFLNVHEGPSGISWRPYPRDPGLGPGQVLSNEPGYYKVGEYGIRHEDLVEIVLINKDSDHPRAKFLKGDYDGRGVLGFRTLTLVPHHRACIIVDLLDDFELNYLNAYHKRVFEVIGGIMKERGLKEDYEWLEQECAPLSRG